MSWLVKGSCLILHAWFFLINKKAAHTALPVRIWHMTENLVYYAPNFEEVDGAYWFRVVGACILSSKTVHARVLKFHIWIPHGKIADTCFFFSCPRYLPFWSYAPLKKMRMKSDACHILWTMHARVWNFHIWILHGKIADPYFFFLVWVISLFGVTSLWKNQNEIFSARYLEKYLS